MIGAESPGPLTDAATALSIAVVAIGTLVGLFFSRRAAAQGRVNAEKFEVPTGYDQETRAPGPVLAQMEQELHGAVKAASDARDTAEKLGTRMEKKVGSVEGKVDQLRVDFAEHRGEHKGFMRELERTMRKVFNENGGSKGA